MESLKAISECYAEGSLFEYSSPETNYTTSKDYLFESEQESAFPLALPSQLSDQLINNENYGIEEDLTRDSISEDKVPQFPISHYKWKQYGQKKLSEKNGGG